MPSTQGLDEETEWQECRTTIGRLDGTIADLQKFGFSLVTILITANALFGEQTLSTAGKTNGGSDHKWAVPIAIDVLITALFFVDRYYVLLLNAAVERALDIEGPKMPTVNTSTLTRMGNKLTQMMSLYARTSKTVFIVPLLYVAFLVANGLIGFALASGHLTEQWSAFAACVIVIGIYFVYTEGKLKTGSLDARRSSGA